MHKGEDTETDQLDDRGRELLKKIQNQYEVFYKHLGAKAREKVCIPDRQRIINLALRSQLKRMIKINAEIKKKK